MTRFFVLLFLFSATATSLSAQTVDASVCDILSNPQSFDGKIVRVKGEIASGFEEFVLRDSSCKQSIDGIWLSYPEGTKAKAGPAALVQLQLARNSSAAVVNPNKSTVKLDKDKNFKEFDSLLSTPYKSGGMCLGCMRYTVAATVVGRLDGVKEAGVVRNTAGKFIGISGYGTLNLYRARLVLQSVSDVSGHEIDYSKTISATKDDAASESSGGDPVAAAHQAARAFSPDSQSAKQVERAADAFGKPGEDNGVEVGFGVANEVTKNDGPQSDQNSPDGLVFNCTFDMGRLKGDGLAHAITHVGTHVADIRENQTSTAGEKAYDLEYRAWRTTVLSAVASKQKTLRLPGGYLVWNSAWAAADRNKLVDEGIDSFLNDWAFLKK